MVATRLNVAAFEATCGDDRVELIDGDVVPMAPAADDASSTGSMINALPGAHVVPRGLGRLSNADGGFVLFPDRETVRAPDVAFVRADPMP